MMKLLEIVVVIIVSFLAFASIAMLIGYGIEKLT